MRLSLLAETDDELRNGFPNHAKESRLPCWPWIKVPLILGAELHSFTPPWKGQTILVALRNGGGVLGEAAKLCPGDSGVNVATLFQKHQRASAALTTYDMPALRSIPNILRVILKFASGGHGKGTK